MDGIRGAASGASPSLLAQYRHLLRALLDVRSAPEDAPSTVLGYKLDIDERGVLRSAPASRSQLAVTNQEQSNAQRLTAEAQARGEDVVSINIKYGAALVDNKLALVNGRTEVVSIKREETDLALAVYNANKEAAHSVRPVDLSDDGALRRLVVGLVTGSGGK